MTCIGSMYVIQISSKLLAAFNGRDNVNFQNYKAIERMK